MQARLVSAIQDKFQHLRFSTQTCLGLVFRPRGMRVTLQSLSFAVVDRTPAPPLLAQERTRGLDADETPLFLVVSVVLCA